VPRLPRKVKVDVTKCHACHAKNRGVHGVIWEPSAPPEPAQRRQCHACYAKSRGVRGVHGVIWEPGAAARASPVPSVPCLPRKVKVDATKCHACHFVCLCV